MAKTNDEPVLEFRLSRRESFHCSFCGTKPDEGAFVVTGKISDLIAAFEAHVEQYHSKGEDFSQAGAVAQLMTQPIPPIMRGILKKPL
ncbi:MAG: hypothetical protein ACLQOO_32800 [Terriglobia bacterium]